ncbi:MAG: J domain-containing protein [Hyphomonadaceae bacterium]
MSETFAYRPKFVDIRVKKPGAAAVEREPSERPCDHVGCKSAGLHRAPKSREHANQFWHFCAAHAAEYNKRWDYFKGMTDAELDDYRKKEEIGHRPTWTFRGGRGDRIAAAGRGKGVGGAADPFGMFGGDPNAAPAKARRRLTRLQALALEVMELEENATKAQIRAKYAELVKRWHPDSNGGDRGAEQNLQKAIKAYQTLKAGGLV